MNKSSCPQPNRHKSTAYSQYLALESRLVFDGAVVATAVEAQPNTPNNDSTTSTDNNIGVTAVVPQAPVVDFLPENNTPQVVDYLPNADSSNNQPNFPIAEKSLNPIDSPALTDITKQPTAIIVVDPRAENAALLALNPPANTQIIVLDPTRDGFQQITEQLQGRNEVTELHILPWTQDKQQWLGSQSLTATLEPSVSLSLMTWNDGLANDAKLVFHGQNSMGTDWAVYVSTLTGTQTSWSTDNSFVQNDSQLSTDEPATIYFIDSAVQNAADIVSSIDAGAQIVYLDANKDGLTQIADYLAGRSNIDSIQIISHSKEATLYLGNDILSRDDLTDYKNQLATIGKSLTVDGDILFYGCELAKSTDGSDFIDYFSYLTQADVAASTDFTGAASKGGNWTLEYTAGTIEASILAASHYQDILAFPTYDVNGGALLFNNPTIQIPNGLTTGSVVVFNNVITIGGQAIDAVVTIVQNTNIAINFLDSAVPGTPPLLGEPAGGNWFDFQVTETQPVPVVADSSNIRFEFIKSGTYGIPGGEVTLKNVVVNSYDIDNGQFQEFSGFSSYVVATNTHLDIIPLPGNFTRFQDKVPNLSDGSALGTPASDQFRVTAFYDELHSFDIKVGTNKTSEAYFYLDFSAGLTWNNPANNPPVNTVPTAQIVDVGVPTNIPGLSATDINSNLASTRLSVGSGKLTVDLTGGATISSGANGTGILTLSGTEAQIKAALATVKYTANDGTSIDTLNILSTDKLGLTDSDNVAINVINRPPIAVDDTKTGDVGKPIDVNVVGNDSDPDNNLDPKTVKIVGTANPGDPLFVPGQGTWSVDKATGIITFTPIAGFTTNPTPINYTVKDTYGLESNPALVTITVNQPPVATPDTVRTDPGIPVIINVTGNDTDPNNNLDPTTVKIVGTTNPGDPLFVPGQGTWTVSPTGEITFTPIAGFLDSPTPINYTVKDTTGLESAPAIVTITTNTIPLAIPDRNIAIEGGPPISGNLINNDNIPGDRPAIVIEANQGGIPITLGVEFATAAGGFITINADGSYSYRPPLQGGLIESFNYTIRDSNGDISSTTLNISVPGTRTSGTPIALGTSGSIILLSNPPLPAFIPEIEKSNFFVAPRPFIEPKAIDLRLYIPTPDGVISLTGSLRDQVVLELQRFSFDIPSWSFRHTNPNAQLEFDATHPDGSALPSWLKFDPKFLRFSGIPPKGAHNEHVMVTVTDTYGQEVHAYFTVHVNKERVRPEHKSLKIDLKLMGLSKESENHHHKEKTHKDKPAVSKSGLSERMQTVGKLGKLQESRVLLDRLKQEER